MNASPSDLKRTRNEWVAELRRRNIRPTRSMGQNFLVEPNIVRDIANIAGISAGAHVVEIGPGMGILTRELLSREALVHAVELDHDLARVLREELGQLPSFLLEERDARFVDTTSFHDGNSYQVVANLPYNMATVIIRHLVGSPHPPTKLTVMVQREVAERMTAAPGEMSLLGIASQLFADCKIEFLIPPDVFFPPPKVESAVVTMVPRSDLTLNDTDQDRLFALATMAFQRKRKTLANGLSQGLDIEKSVVYSTLSAVGIDPMRRPQSLSVSEWILISVAFAT